MVAGLENLKELGTALLKAAGDGNTPEVAKLIGQGAPVDGVRNPLRRTALMLAAENGHTDTVNALAGTHNANVDAADENGATALMLAAMNGDADTVNALAGTHNANVELMDVWGCTASTCAAAGGHEDVVKALAAHYIAFDYDSFDSDCTSYGHRGSYCDCAVCVLIENLEDGDHFQAKKAIEALRFDVNVPFEGDGRTPLMIACELGHSNLVDVLVRDLKSDVNAANSRGETALMFAAKAKMVKMVMTLVNKYKANVDAEDRNGSTALFYAISAKHVDVINVLLGTCKANVEHRMAEAGTRPLMVATQMGAVDIVNLLCSRHKADTNAHNSRGQTALMLACQKGHPDVVQALAGRHKARVDIRCNEGMMALHYAALNGKHEIVDMLIGKYGADVEARTTGLDELHSGRLFSGRTALHFAALCGSLDTVKVLVNKYDANVVALDDVSGLTPLELAQGADGNEAIIEILSDRSFIVSVRSKEGDATDIEADCEEGTDGMKNEECQEDVRLRINTSTKAQRVVDAFCTKKGRKPEDVVFSFKGKELSITASTTIGDLGLGKNDCINASLKLSLLDLHNAVIKGDIAEIHRIGSLKVVDLNGMLGGETAVTALMLSVYCDKPKALVKLLEMGADVNRTNEKGWTALWLATQAKRPNSMDIFRELLKHSPLLGAVDREHGRTVLFMAVAMDSVERAKALVGAGASVTATDREGKTPLSLARERGNQEMIKMLEAAKLNPVCPGPDSSLDDVGQKEQAPSAAQASRLALEHEEKVRAKKQREEELARKLAEEEEALNRKFADEARKRAEEEAQQVKQRAIIEEAQRKASAEEKARIEACKVQKRAEEEERRRKLEEEQAAIRRRDMALKKALEKEEKAIRKQKKKEAGQEAKAKLRALVQEKEEHVKTKAKAEPLRVLRRPANDSSMSSDFNPTDPVELLIKFAAEGDTLNITHLINHENVDANARHPKTGMTAVMAAAWHGRGSTMRSLVKKKAMIEAVDNEGRTALMHAILGNQPVMVKDLLDHYQVELSATDNRGETPISMAKNLGLDTIVEHLKEQEKQFSRTHEQGKQDPPANPVSDEPDQPIMNARQDDSRPKDSMSSPGGFFGDLSSNIGLPHGLDGALEYGLNAPPEEPLPDKEAHDPIANGRDERLQQSLFSLDISNNVHNSDDIMEELLKEVNNVTNESCDEINLVAEGVPLPFSNVGLGGLLASAPVPADNAISGAGFIEDMFGSNLFGPMLSTQNDGLNSAVQPSVPMTAAEIESRLRKPPGFDRSPTRLSASVRDLEKEREREWTEVLEKKVEKLVNFRTDTEKRLKTLTKERDSLRKQVSNQDRRLAGYERRMKSMEQKIDQLLKLVKLKEMENCPEPNSAKLL